MLSVSTSSHGIGFVSVYLSAIYLVEWCGLCLSGLGQGPVKGPYGQGNVPSGSIKYW
jgi:hypothetical protein